jgi:hypothetical protein
VGGEVDLTHLLKNFNSPLIPIQLWPPATPLTY